jgi:F0F1-type ATP synthase membrane subunit b/b'
MYLDPGTGSVVVQAVLAALLGLGVFIKLFWGKITSLFGKKEDQINKEDEE